MSTPLQIGLLVFPKVTQLDLTGDLSQHLDMDL